MDQINATATNLINIGTGIAFLVCVGFIVWGGLQWSAAGGNPRAMESAKSTIMNALLGLALVLAARVIATIIQGAVVV